MPWSKVLEDQSLKDAGWQIRSLQTLSKLISNRKQLSVPVNSECLSNHIQCAFTLNKTLSLLSWQ